jgi:TIR domain
MANLFVSFAWTDLDLARSLQIRMSDRGHRTRIPVGAAVAGNWRSKYSQALASADVTVVLVTEKALASRNVLGEVGAARVLEHVRGMILLPVLVGSISIPEFINDIYCFRLEDPNDLDKLVDDLCKCIDDNTRLVPRIFVSHRHKDEAVVSSLTALLEQAFVVESTDIRCTSVQPYMLTPGERTSELLRKEIAGAELVIGVLSPDTIESNYVLCELGASWGRDVPTFPVLIRGATYADVPSPLSERHSISLEKEENQQDVAAAAAGRGRQGGAAGPRIGSGRAGEGVGTSSPSTPTLGTWSAES